MSLPSTTPPRLTGRPATKTVSTSVDWAERTKAGEDAFVDGPRVGRMGLVWRRADRRAVPEQHPRAGRAGPSIAASACSAEVSAWHQSKTEVCEDNGSADLPVVAERSAVSWLIVRCPGWRRDNCSVRHPIVSCVHPGPGSAGGKLGVS